MCAARIYDERTPSRLRITGVVIFYMVSALVMVFVNKAVLNSTPELPFTFLFIQLIIAVTLLHTLAWVVPDSHPLKAQVALPEVNAEMAYKLLPVVSVGVIALVFNTLCLRNVDASFFQIARGLLLPCTILINALATRITPRSNVIRAAALVTVGFFLGISPGSFFKSSDIASSGEVIGSSTPSVSILESTKYMWKDVAQNMDRDKALALVYGTLSAFMTAVHAVLVKSAVKTLEGSVLRLTYWSNMMSGIFLLPCILLNGEVSIFMTKIVLASSDTAGSNEIYERAVERSTFFIGSLVTGFFGFLLGLAGLLSIKVTSPVSHMVSSAARSVLQTVLGVWLFGEIVTGRRALSIMVITCGALYYTWIQSASMPSPSSSTTEEDEEEEEGAKVDTTARMRRGGNMVPREWYRHHGHTHSLATLLPLHAPRALRPFGGAGSHGANGNGTTTDGRFLGSISEEEEYYASLAGNGGVVDEEKMALLPEEDRARFFRDHVLAGEQRDHEHGTEKI